MQHHLAKTISALVIVAVFGPCGAAWAAPINGGTVAVAANYHPGGANAQEQQRIASTHDLVVLGTGWADAGPPSTYYQVNPAMVALVYQSWFDISPSSPDYGVVSQHEDWFYHDAAGNRITTYSTEELPDCDPALCRTDSAQCNCRFGMNMGHPDYRAFVAARFADLVAGGGAWGGSRGFDGIFLDNTNPQWPYRPAKVSSGWVSATPVYPGAQTQTEATWVADQKGFLQVVKNAMGTEKLLIYNACVASANYPTWKQQSYAFLEHADGCTMEEWVVRGIGTSASAKLGSEWDSDMDLFMGVASRGKWATPLIGSGVHSSAVNRYGIASVLLFRENDKAFMNFWKGSALEAIAGRFTQTFPEALINLGVPQGTFSRLSNGVASRQYSLGRVLLNPTPSAQTVALGETMRTVAGAQVTSVTLASGTAEILTRVGSTNDPPPAAVDGLQRTDRR